jgi:hypothetical protein
VLPVGEEEKDLLAKDPLAAASSTEQKQMEIISCLDRVGRVGGKLAGKVGVSS